MTSYRPPIFVLCVVLLTVVTGLNTTLQNAITAMRFELLPRHAGAGVVVVAIDPPSIEHFGVWPWPRGIHAELINRLDRAGAAEIFLDVDFSTPSTPAADKALENALEAAGGSIILPTFKQRLRRDGESRIFINRPLPQFAKHAWQATVNVEPDADGVVRSYSFGSRIDDTFVPSAGGLMAGLYEERDFLVDFGIRTKSIPIVSYRDVIRDDPVAIERIKDKKVIVGATAIELGDRINVPNGRVIPGAMLTALAVESILQGRALQSSSVPVTIAGLALIMIAMAALWRRFAANRRLLVLVLLAAGIEGAGIVLQAFSPVVLDTAFFHAAILGYVIALALDEIDSRGLMELIAERRFQRIAMSLGDGLACLDHAGRVTLWNAGAAAMFGYASAEIVGRDFGRLIASDSTASATAGGLLALPPDQLQTPGGWVTELDGVRHNGEKFPLEVCISSWPGADGAQYGVLMRDISVRKREEARIRYLASYDTLTGLPNRNMLVSDLESRIAAARAGATDVALLMLDLNRLKDINDSLGHACGDAVLREVAARLRGLAGESGLVARLGADEFAIVIAGQEIRDTADRLASAIHRSFAHEELTDAGERLRVTFSIGVALFPHHSGTAEQLLADADLALARGKAAGAGLHVFFDPAFRSELETRLWMRSELDRAYERGEFELFYQPQIRLRDSKVVGAEALIRWNHPERGLVSPGDFIPILDTTPIAVKVARWIMETACRQGARWLREGHELRIGVNLSPSQFRSGDLAAVTKEVLAETGFPPSLLELEVTENILLGDDQRALAVFGQLRDLGVHLAWDDFGTGYASLTYLKKFPLNRLKIDQLFVRDIAPGSNDAAIVEYTINLARTLGLAVVAEGVETKATEDLLVRLGCEEAQGYHFGRPLPVGRFEKTFLGEPPATEAWRAAANADAA